MRSITPWRLHLFNNRVVSQSGVDTETSQGNGNRGLPRAEGILRQQDHAAPPLPPSSVVANIGLRLGGPGEWSPLALLTKTHDPANDPCRGVYKRATT